MLLKNFRSRSSAAEGKQIHWPVGLAAVMHHSFHGTITSCYSALTERFLALQDLFIGEHEAYY